MSRLPFVQPPVICGVPVICGAFVVWSALATAGFTQEPASPLAAAQAVNGKAPADDLLEKFRSFDHKWWHPQGADRELAGVQNCVLCHAKSNIDEPLPPGILPPGGADDAWVLLNELRTWGEKDKHYQAYAVLHNDRSQKMAKLLGVVDAEGKSLIHRDKRCLACHSAWPVHQLQADERGLITDALANDPRVNLGVSCEGCHGPSLTPVQNAAKPAVAQLGWNDIHRTKTQWRFMPPQEKFDTYGFWNVRSPVTKARICLSCHLGNVEQGKLLTHDMYAAGHPPLPGFEIATFIDQQPQHWRDFGDKKPAIREEFLKETKTAYREENLHRSRALLIGALVGLSETLRLTADLIDQQAAALVEKPNWPEFANFACFACHHDLATPAWRQQREVTSRPGRPLLHEWPDTLAGVALTSAGFSLDDYKKQLQPVHQALRSQPFGDPTTLQPAARKAARWCYDAAVQLENTELTTPQGWQILEELCRTGSSRTLDYDSARLLVWSCRVVYDELRPRPLQPKRVPGDLSGWYRDRNDLDDVEAVLASLNKTFILDLRDGRQTKQLIAGQARPQTEVELQTTLPFVSNYAPDKFRAEFKKLAEHVAQRKKSAEK